MKSIQKRDIDILCDYLGYKSVDVAQEVMPQETIVVMSGDKKIYTNYKELRAKAFDMLLAV
jgi:hypothetical protein